VSRRRWESGLDLSHHDADAAALAKDIDTKTTEAIGGDRQVHLHLLFEDRLLALGHERVGERLGVGRRQARQGKRCGDAFDAQHWRALRREVQIGGALAAHLFEEGANV
jgi:hypothetical protein